MKDGSAANDNLEASTEQSAQQPERKEYRVVSENGLLKNGTHYKTGKIVELDEKTAANFLEAGDIEEIK